MKTLLIYTLLAVVLLLLSACESGAKFIVHNNTSFPVHTAVDEGDEVSIPAHSTYSFDVDTPTQSIFTGEVSRSVQVYMKGETYAIYDDFYDLWTDYTSITVKAGEDTHAYLEPNRASIKITNNSAKKITEAAISKNHGIAVIPFANLLDILPGETKFMRVDYFTTSDPFSYIVEITTEDGDTYTYGDSSTVLAVDQQYAIVFTEDTK